MAIVTCKECGRAISDKAAACIGCGAPLSTISGFNLFPERTPQGKPLSRQQFVLQAILATVLLIAGALLAGYAEQPAHASRPISTIAALIVIGGLCWLVSCLLRWIGAKRQRNQ